MTYKEKFLENWTKAGGLITKRTASKILGVDKSVLSKNKKIKIWIIEDSQFVSLQEILSCDIKPRKKRKKKN